MRAVTLALAALLPLQIQAQAQAEPGEKAQAEAAEALLKDQMRQRRIPGLQAAVVHHGKIVLLGAYGLASVEHAVPVARDTVFSINSATKCFTGVAAMQLVEEGKLDLSAPVSRYLEGLPEAWRPVSVRQLLTHTSGIPNIVDQATGRLVASGDEAAWAKVQTLPMAFAPGAKSSYNQTNYLLLGRIIDKLSGEPFTRFIAERQFRAVGMPRTAQSGFVDSHDVVPRSARSYTFYREFQGQLVQTDRMGTVFEEFPPFIRTGAGIETTAEELARWIIALQEGRLFKAKGSLAALWTPATRTDGTPSSWALGWPLISRAEHPAVAGIGGARSAFYVYPQDDLAVVVLTNLQGAAPETFIDEVAGCFIPDMSEASGFGLPSAVRALRAQLLKRGFDHAEEVADELRKRDAAFTLGEEDLNAWGYHLLGRKQVKEAVEILKLNTSLHPASANTYDSLAEALEAAGDGRAAILDYKRSLELDPKNLHAVQRLKVLEGN